MSGPQVERLRSGVAGANRHVIKTAHTEWANGALLLNKVAESLSGAAPNIHGQIGKSGRAAAEAFRAVSAKVTQRADQMDAAAKALDAAFEALKHAETVRDDILDNPPLDPGPRPTPTPGIDMSQDDITAMKIWNARSNLASAQASDQETKAQQAADHLEDVYKQSTQTMKKVHGQPDPPKKKPPIKDDSTGGGGGGTPPGGGTAPPGGGTAPPGGGGKHPSPTITHPDGNNNGTDVHWTDNHPVPVGGNDDPTGGDTTVVDPWLPPGSEQGGVTPAPSTIGGVPGGGSISTGSHGSTLGATGGVAGALGGGVMGGLGGITGAVRGPSVVPTGGAAGTSGRAIGSTTRTGTTGALGRGTSAATAGSPTSARGGARGSAAGGARSAGGGTRGAGKAGSRGAAGSRGSAGGGRGGKNKKDPKKKGTDFFEEEQDWIDDEGVAPPVID